MNDSDDFEEASLPEIAGDATLPPPQEAGATDNDELPLPELADAVKDWISERGWLPPEQVEQLFAEARATITETGGSVLPILHGRELLNREQLSELEEVERLNDTLPRFILEKRLGAGAVGAVYLANDRETGTRVALKFLHEHIDGMEEHRERFEREAAALAQLQHPVIPRLIDHSKAMERGDMWIAGTIYEQPPYLAMEYVGGMTLRDLINGAGTVPEGFALWIASQVARGLDHAYSQAGIIHRDIKPDNIIIQYPQDRPLADLWDRRCPLKIIDFGLAKISTGDGSGAYAGQSSGAQGSIAEDSTGELTMTGAVVGTPRYMAPEQIMGEQVDWEADLYSLGATLYHLITGQPPFSASSPTEVMMAHLQQPVPDPRAIVEQLSSRTTRVVMRAMEKKAKSRFPSYTDFAEACERAINALGHDSGTQALSGSRRTSSGAHRLRGSGAHPTGSGAQQTDSGAHRTGSGGYRPSTGSHRVGTGSHPARGGTSGIRRIGSGAQRLQTAPAEDVAEDPFSAVEQEQRRSADASDSTIATDRLTRAIQQRVANDLGSIQVPDLSAEREAQHEATRRILNKRDTDVPIERDNRPWIFVALAVVIAVAVLLLNIFNE